MPGNIPFSSCHLCTLPLIYEIWKHAHSLQLIFPHEIPFLILKKFSHLIIASYPSDATFCAGASVLKRSIGKEVASPVNWSVNSRVIA